MGSGAVKAEPCKWRLKHRYISTSLLSDRTRIWYFSSNKFHTHHPVVFCCNSIAETVMICPNATKFSITAFGCVWTDHSYLCSAVYVEQFRFYSRFVQSVAFRFQVRDTSCCIKLSSSLRLLSITFLHVIIFSICRVSVQAFPCLFIFQLAKIHVLQEHFSFK